MYYSIFKDLCDEFSVKPSTVAKETGISIPLLSNWKAGRRTPGTDTLLKISEYFNVSLDYLKGNTTNRNENTASIKSIAEQDAKMVSDANFMKIVRSLYVKKEKNPENFSSTFSIYNSIDQLSSKDKSTLKEFINYLHWKKNNSVTNWNEGDNSND